MSTAEQFWMLAAVVVGLAICTIAFPVIHRFLSILVITWMLRKYWHLFDTDRDH